MDHCLIACELEITPGPDAREQIAASSPVGGTIDGASVTDHHGAVVCIRNRFQSALDVIDGALRLDEAPVEGFEEIGPQTRSRQPLGAS